MALTTATATNYQQLLKDYQAKSAGVETWEQLFRTPFDEAQEQVQIQADYDISGAYANYKQNQMSLAQNTALSTGFKEQVNQDLLGSYEYDKAYIEQEEASNVTDIQQTYLNTLAEQEGYLLDLGQQFADIEKAAYEYAGIADLNTLNMDIDAGGLGYYTTQDGNTTLTVEGTDFFDRVFHDEPYGDNTEFFSDYLLNNNEELYNFYVQNKGTINELVAGLSSTDMSYDTSERRDTIDATNAQKLFEETIAQQSDSTKSYYSNITTDFETDAERATYYNELNAQLTNAPEYRGIAENTGSFFNPKVTYDGVEYNAKAVFKSSLASAIQSELEITNKLRDAKLQIGDVVEYKGDLYVISNSSNNHYSVEFLKILK